MFDLRYALEKCVRRETGSLLFLLCVGKVRSVFEVLLQTRLLRRRFMFQLWLLWILYLAVIFAIYLYSTTIIRTLQQRQSALLAWCEGRQFCFYHPWFCILVYHDCGCPSSPSSFTIPSSSSSPSSSSCRWPPPCSSSSAIGITSTASKRNFTRLQSFLFLYCSSHFESHVL